MEPKIMHYKAGEVLLFDKPAGWSSFDVVKKVRNLVNRQLKVKVGHAGTLDPLATGLLVLCTGKKTKAIEDIQAQTKVYTGTITLGKTTPSFDAETAFDTENDPTAVSIAALKTAATQFIGEIWQKPPIYSAVKVDGKRAYKAARSGKSLEMKPRKVQVYDFQINADNFPVISFSLHCSKGTYVRSLAHDLGQAVEVGAYLSDLRRTQIGDYKVEAAWKIDDFALQVQEGALVPDPEEIAAFQG